MRRYSLGIAVIALVLSIGAWLGGELQNAGARAEARADPLLSWNDGPAKKAILDLVRVTTDKDSPKYVPPAARIATFDQDGTLWVEHPMYTQVLYCLERVPTVVKQKPELKDVEPFKTVLSGDRAAIAKLSMKDLEEILMATLSGMTVEEFTAEVKKWLATAKHPRYKRPYTECVYQPMLEVLKYLRANGYKTYIVTGGGQDFVRAYAEEVYGIPPEQVVGTMGGTKYGYDKDGRPMLTKEPRLLLNDNNAGKPEGIHLMIGRRPVAAFGNTAGDQQMLEYTTAGDGARLGMLLLHDDAKREYAYGPAEGLPDTKVGTFTQALYDEAKKQGWVVISMKNDWRRLFPFDEGSDGLGGRTTRAAASSPNPQDDRSAMITVQVPADAEIWFDGEKTSQTGASRVFRSPPLEAGRNYSYEVKARWSADGQPVEQTRKVHVWAGATVQVTFPEPVTAIDILLEPDATMVKHAEAANERLLKVFPKGFALGKTHQPHISCLQRYVRTADLDKVYEAVGKVLAEEKPTAWKLKAYKYYYIPWKEIGLAGIVIEPTDDLIRYQKKLIDAVEPFTVKTGTAAAFVTTKEDPDINQPTIDYVETFVPKASGKNFNPHVTIGIATQDYLKKMLDEKFESFTFSPEGASVYHLGNFGTARKKLKSWELKP